MASPPPRHWSTRASRALYALSSRSLLTRYFRGELRANLRTVSIPVVGFLGADFCLWAICGAGREPLKWCACLIAAGVPVYYAFQRRTS